MAHLEGFSTVRPPFYNGDDFRYWKGRMECFLKTQIEMWIIIQTGFTLPTNEAGESLDYDQWTNAMKRQVEADAKATQILQCGLSKEELNRVGPFISAKDLWNKLVELHEGTDDAKVCKRDLLMNKLYNLKMQEHETSTQLHARIQDVVNSLHAIGQKVENRDLIRYALNAFPRTTLWASMVDAYKVSKDLSKIRLDELFSEFELHEQSNSAPEKGIALFAGSKKKPTTKQPSKEEEDECESEVDAEMEIELVNLVRKMIKRRK